MPDTAVHASFGQEVLRSLDGRVRETIVSAPYQIALFGPDLWFVRFPAGKHGKRGRRMHTDRTGDFLCALARHARDGSCPETMFSYLAGFLCHYALDAATHPYVIRKTTGEGVPSGAHRAFEHTLDILELQRLGLWEGRHPLTRSLMPRLRLPREMREDLDAAYREVYGWKNSYRELNRLYPLFRFLYARMENPKGLAAFLARLTGKPVFRSLAYSESWYNGTDVENSGGETWIHSYDESRHSAATFAHLREQARERAVTLINACYRYIILREIGDAELRELIGSDSYLSGLPVRDPRNWNVSSLLPAPGAPRDDPA